MATIQDANAILIDKNAALDTIDFDKEGYCQSFEAVQSIVNVVNKFFQNKIEYTNIPKKMLETYYVDFYATQMMNGGFAQFVVNCRANDLILSYVGGGLKIIGAKKNLDLFNKKTDNLRKISKTKIETFINNYRELASSSEEANLLGEWDDDFFDLNNDISYETFNRDDTTGEHIAPLLLKWIAEDENLVRATWTDISNEIERRAKLYAAQA